MPLSDLKLFTLNYFSWYTKSIFQNWLQIIEMGSMESIIITLIIVELEVTSAYNLFRNNLFPFPNNINNWMHIVNF
jgi:hypothetical protein